MIITKIKRVVILTVVAMMLFNGILPATRKVAYAVQEGKISDLSSVAIANLNKRLNLFDKKRWDHQDKITGEENDVAFAFLQSNTDMQFSVRDGHLVITTKLGKDANGKDTVLKEPIQVELKDFVLNDVYADDYNGDDGYQPYQLFMSNLKEDENGTVYLSFNLGDRKYEGEGEFSRVQPKSNFFKVSLTDVSSTSVNVTNTGGTAGVSVALTPKEKETFLQSLEKAFSLLLNNIAGFINAMVSSALLSKDDRASKNQLTIDSLVFNKYPETQLTYFFEPDDPDLPERRSNLIWGREGKSDVSRWNLFHIGSDAINGRAGSGEAGLYVTVNAWYRLFRSVAIIGYMIILVYMGIRIMLSSTGQDLSRYKSLFMYWVIGVIILFFYPYVMKYAIILNNTFVDIVSKSVHNSVGEIEYASVERIEINENASVNSNSVPDYSEKSPFSEGKDYMSAIANSAITHKRLALSFAYLILTWQLITLIVHYYKRVFMTGFLITIFPLVGLSYAVDKIADGKSQAFNTWNKEYILNVFIQSFHAIVYAFVCGTVYASGAGNIENYDFVLIIVGVTFLFTGEEIIKKIFSQSSPAGTVSSLGNTAAATFAKVKLAQTAITAVGKPLIGKDSIVNRVKTGLNERKVATTKRDLFDKFSKPVEPPNVGERLPGYQKEINQSNQNSAHTRNLANAIAGLNNRNSRSLAELADHLELILRERRLNPNNALLKDLVMPDSELAEIEAIEHHVAGMMANGILDPVTLIREVQVRLGIDVDAESINLDKKRKMDMVMAHIELYGADRGFTKDKTRAEMQGYLDEIKDIQDSMKIVNDRDITTAKLATKSDKIEEIEKVMGDNLSADEKKFARAFATCTHMGEGFFTTEEELKALNDLNSLVGNSARAQALYNQISERELNVTRHIYARKVAQMAQIQDGIVLGEVEANTKERERIKKEVLYDGENPGVWTDDKRVAMSIAMLKNREKGIFTKNEQLEAIRRIQTLGDSSDTTREMVSHFMEEENLDLELTAKVISNMSADKSITTISNEAKAEAERTIADLENGHERDNHFDDEFAAHELIEHYGDKEALEDVFERIHTQRRITNQVERGLTRDVAKEYFASEGIDINEGGIDTETRYFMEQTQEDIDVEVRNATENIFRRVLTGSTRGTSGGVPGESRTDTFRGNLDGIKGALNEILGRKDSPYTRFYQGKTYEENRKAIRDHFIGDQPKNNNSNHS